MAYVMVDVEADGPIPGDYSMICFGAVIVREGLDHVFYGRLKPISEKWIPQALAVSGFSREVTLGFDDPKNVMESFALWIEENTKGRAMFVWISFGPDDGIARDRLFVNVIGRPQIPALNDPDLAENRALIPVLEKCLASRPAIAQTTPPPPKKAH